MNSASVTDANDLEQARLRFNHWLQNEPQHLATLRRGSYREVRIACGWAFAAGRIFADPLIFIDRSKAIGLKNAMIEGDDALDAWLSIQGNGTPIAATPLLQCDAVIGTEVSHPYPTTDAAAKNKLFAAYCVGIDYALRERAAHNARQTSRLGAVG
jgi:hypothetical protein